MTEESGPLLSPGFWLHHAALVWRAELDARLRPLGLTPTQFMLLASAGWLEHTSGPPTQQAVAEQAGADRMMTSKIVRALEERDLLVRRQDSGDARAVRLSLTATGRALVRKATAIARDLDNEFFGADPAKMRAALRGIASRQG
ncbi:MarR family winged helix-turn-helix transcriptional regulator [Fodinicola acaciae]|uniref:MarR family winged helix-turn-helix transcriptional regulator n=1 Tax=Fodinicola acaciae TaxID=2681555 RepID=UPI0013D27436|nr:MarR family transcriptional regulator [Fodinicola acaciae]